MTELTAERLDELKRLAKDGKLNLFFMNAEDRGDMTVDDLVALIEAARASLWRPTVEQLVGAMVTHLSDIEGHDIDNLGDGESVVIFHSAHGSVATNLVMLAEAIQALPTPPSEGES